MMNDNLNRKENFNEEVLDLRRVTRVVAGGKRFRFRATVVIGDGNGRVGIGVAKGSDVEQAVGKGRVQAKKNLIKIKMKDRTISREVEAKFSAAKVLIKPSAAGKGLTAGGAVRVVLKLAGVQDATAKCLGTTTNKLTNALAAVKALSQLKAQDN
ncbi:MAG: 30S ribosomal protein S5 [Patescibacteria group bacterium]|nr:30S ribosomal protein S5 [Patescibacteria group bacterium]MDE2144663.1 30S ribosomal protein S5 [Patescibacteria group bacterium]